MYGSIWFLENIHTLKMFATAFLSMLYASGFTPFFKNIQIDKMP